MKSTRSTKRRGSWRVITMISRQLETMSFAPPLPGSRTLGLFGSPMKLVLTLPNWSICASADEPVVEAAALRVQEQVVDRP